MCGSLHVVKAVRTSDTFDAPEDEEDLSLNFLVCTCVSNKHSWKLTPRSAHSFPSYPARSLSWNSSRAFVNSSPERFSSIADRDDGVVILQAETEVYVEDE